MTAPIPTVEACTTFRLITPDEPAERVPVTLRFDADDPFAVRVLFRDVVDADGDPLTWCFGRELLVTGLDEPAGIGAVRVWPWVSGRGDFVAIATSSTEGNNLFEVPRDVLLRFLRRTYIVVPRGRESDFLDVDGAVNRLLAGGAR